MSRPEPRPALQRSGDGGVHPAAPRVSTEQHVHPAPHAPAAATKASKKRKGAKTIDRADDSAVIAKDATPDEDVLATFTGKAGDAHGHGPEGPPQAGAQGVRARRRSLSTTVVAEALARHVARQP